MRACLLSTVHHAFDTRVYHREAGSLVSAGYEVRLIVQYDRNEATVNGVHIIGLSAAKHRGDRIRRGWQAFRLALHQRADIYHFHDPELIPWGILLRLFSAKPVVYDVHEHYPDSIAVKQWLPRFLRQALARIFDCGEQTAAKFFDALIVADETIAKRFQRRHPRVVVIYNYPGRHAFSDEKDGTASLTRQHETQLVYVGAISQSRGIWLMLDVTRLLVTDYGLDVGLWIAGRFGYAHEEREFEKRLEADDELKARVKWVGLLPYEEVPRLLSRADIGLVPLQPIPKFQKNIPTKQFEYMAAGLPIVASDLAPIRRYIEAAQAGKLAIADDARSHAAKAAYLIQHPTEAEQMGRNGQHAFETQYNWDSEAKKLIGLYESLVR